MQIEIAVLSKPGGRERNEDACGYWTSEDACCWVLSDGLGGHGGRHSLKTGGEYDSAWICSKAIG